MPTLHTIMTCHWCSKPLPANRLRSCSAWCLHKLYEAERRLELEDRVEDERMNPERAVALFESMCS